MTGLNQKDYQDLPRAGTSFVCDPARNLVVTWFMRTTCANTALGCSCHDHNQG